MVRRSLFRSENPRRSDSARRADSISTAHAMPRGPPARPLVELRSPVGPPSAVLPVIMRSVGHSPGRLPRRAIHLEETCNNELG